MFKKIIKLLPVLVLTFVMSSVGVASTGADSSSVAEANGISRENFGHRHYRRHVRRHYRHGYGYGYGYGYGRGYGYGHGRGHGYGGCYGYSYGCR